ncbi:YrvL family regulatory protein [Vagococcus sp. JNUCC 83]
MKQLILVVIISMPLITISLIFSGALKLLGATYLHPSNLILFFIVSLAIDFLIDILFHLVIKKESLFLMLCQNIISLMITDYFVESVSLSVQTILLFSLLLVLFEKSVDYLDKDV